MLLQYLNKGVVEAGCDEAGRGCLAGPVFAAAVILPPSFSNDMLNDSKKLTERQRYELRPIIEREAIAWAVGIVDNHEIDRINILRASIEAMHRAISQLKVRPEALLIDGNRFSPFEDIPHVVRAAARMRILLRFACLSRSLQKLSKDLSLSAAVRWQSTQFPVCQRLIIWISFGL